VKKRLGKTEGAEALDLPFPGVIDTPDQKGQQLYDAYPERLVLIGQDGPP
jgi:hypothetical protein